MTSLVWIILILLEPVFMEQPHQGPTREDQRQQLLQSHLFGHQRVSEIFTKFKHPSRSRLINQTHIKDLQELQQILNNNFYFTLLKYQIPQQHPDQDSGSDDDTSEKEQKPSETVSQEVTSYTCSQQKYNFSEEKYHRLREDSERLTRKLMINRIDKEDLTTRLNGYLEKETIRNKFLLGDSSPMESIEYFKQPYKSLQESPKKSLKVVCTPNKANLDRKYDFLEKKIQKVGNQLTNIFENKLKGCFNRESKTYQVGLTSQRHEQENYANLISRKNIRKSAHNATTRLSLIRSNQPMACAQQPPDSVTSKTQTFRRERRGFLITQPKKVPSQRQRSKMVKKVGDFLTFTDDIQNTMENANTKLIELIEEMGTINQAQYARFQEEELEVDIKDMDQIRTQRLARRVRR